jgi:polar amino acid transport system substrate-binding protein
LFKRTLIKVLAAGAFLFSGGLLTAATDAPPLTVVFAEGLEPLCWEENGKPMGEQPEIAEYVLSRLGIKARYLFLPWPRAQKLIERGDADLMMTTPSKARFELAAFGKEMTTPNYWNIFVRKGDTATIEKARAFKNLDDLKGFTILDFSGNGWTEAYMKRSEGFRIDTSAKMEQLVQILVRGRGDLTINSATAVNWFLQKLNLADQVEEIDLAIPATRFQMTFQVSRKSPWFEKGLVRALDIELKKMKDSGEWLKVLQKYRDPYASGRPFESRPVSDDFYRDYDRYTVYKPNL